MPVLPAVSPSVTPQTKSPPVTTRCSFMSLSEYFKPPVADPSSDAAAEQPDASPVIEEGYLLFEVTDTGIGISDDKIKTLFAPFQQAQRFAGGTGLGLFSLARRVEAQHGRYGVRKRDDGTTGSVFWFMLPYVPDTTMEQECDESLTLLGTLSPVRTSVMSELSEAEVTDNGRDSCKSPSSRRLSGLPQAPLNILLVDDSISVMKTTRMMLTKQGHTVDTAVNGADALESLLLKSYDIVLMDIQVCIST